MAVLSKGELFDEHLVRDLFTKVKGKSAIAKLSAQTPIPFNGNKVFTFTMDNDVEIIGENNEKAPGDVTLATKNIVPVKFEYGARVSDEFLFASEEEQINIIESFNDGFAKKLAEGMDIAAMHRLNPRTRTVAGSIPEANAFDTVVTNVVSYDATTPKENIEEAISDIEATNGDVNGMAISPAMRKALAELTDGNGNYMFPQFQFGATPDTLGTHALAVNKSVSTSATTGTTTDHAIVGDFANAFKWGFAKEIPFEIIKYGDPDGRGDLKRQNQVYFRCEAYIGWGILDEDSFALVQETVTP